jgi:hypothetical protein
LNFSATNLASFLLYNQQGVNQDGNSQTKARRPRMKEEGQYGTDGWTVRYDGDVTGELIASANSLQEEPLKEEPSSLSEFLTADRRLLNYHLFFSSKL